MANVPAELKYTKSHEWVKEEDGLYVVGLTDFAQEALGDIVFINMPEEGDDVASGESFADVESVKAVSDVFSPVSGTVAEVNEGLIDEPALINQEPYEQWLIKVKDVSDTEELMDAAAYEEFCAAPYHPFRILPRALIRAEMDNGRYYLHYQEPPTEEPVADEKQIRARVDRFFSWLGGQPWEPALVTLCRSARSGYLPRDKAALVEELVCEGLQRLWGNADT